MTTDNDGFRELRVVFCGKCELYDKSKPLGYAIAPLDAIDAKVNARRNDGGAVSPDDVATVYSPFVFKEVERPRIVGGIYTVRAKCGDDGRITNIRGDLKFSGDRHGSEQLLTLLDTMSKAAEVARRARKAHDELSKDSALEAALAPIKRRYFATDAIGRQAIEVVVLHALRRGL
jgi:hypothetical protein